MTLISHVTLVVYIFAVCFLAGQLSDCKKRSSFETFIALLSQKESNQESATVKRDQKPNAEADLSDRSLFSDSELDCCPTATMLSHRQTAVNWEGLLFELFHTPNFTQSFYETICLPEVKDRPCQFVDPRYREISSCVQQYQYVYAFGRPVNNWREQYRVDYIRVATGCKCRLLFTEADDTAEDYTS